MPTRALVTSYRNDMRLFPDFWHKVGLVIAIGLLLAYPLLLDDRWVTIGSHALIAVVGSLGLIERLCLPPPTCRGWDSFR